MHAKMPYLTFVSRSRSKQARTCVQNEERLELSEAGSGSVDDGCKENVVDNVPYSDNEGNDRLKSQTYLHDIGDENVIVL